MHTVRALALSLAACGSGATAPRGPDTPDRAAAPPAARTVDVVEEKFGLRVVDPYRWMETGDEELATWLRAQGDYTRAWLDRVPGRAALGSRIHELGLGMSVPAHARIAGGRTFYGYTAAGEVLAKLIVRGPDGKDRVLVDPATLGGAGGHASLNDFAPSDDGKLVAYNIALGGGEISTIRVLDVDTGKVLPDAIDRVWGEFRAHWLPDGSGFFYTQMAAPQEGVDPLLNLQARFHRLGDSADEDVAILGNGVGSMPIAPEEFPVIEPVPDSGWAIAWLVGAHPEVRCAIVETSKIDRTGAGKTPWRTVAEYADGIEHAAIHGKRLYLLTTKDAPNRKVVSVPLAKPELAKARTELAEDREVVTESFSVARDALYVQRLASGIGRITRLSWTGTPAELPLPFDGTINAISTDPLRDGALIRMEGWTRPATYYALEPRAHTTRAIGLAAASPADFAGIVAEEVEVESADGTMVPLSILRRADLPLDGSHPTLLRGYGAYGYSQLASFDPMRLAWLERGGVIAVAHVRGGGEKGDGWRIDGTREKKMNGVRDFIACGEYLVAKGYTSPAHLTANGGSAGGILVGRAITERPDLFAAAYISVGLMNPTRILAAPNGANQKLELGDPETEAGYRSLYAVDPYVHVTGGVAYPAVIFAVGLNDARVAPWESAKMAARMQALNPDGRPVLIRIEDDAGHGVGSTRTQTLDERADAWSFLLAAAGDAEFQPR